MIASRTKWAGIAFAGGATLAVLSGCAQAPATYQPSAYNTSAEAMRAYLLDQQQRDAPYYVQPVPAPVVQAAPRRFKTHPAPLDDGPVISGTAPASVPKDTPAGPECSGMWRLCHFL